jgi:hypothetical protein
MIFQIISSTNKVLFQSTTAKSCKETLIQAKQANIDLSNLDFIAPNISLLRTTHQSNT